MKDLERVVTSGIGEPESHREMASACSKLSGWIDAFRDKLVDYSDFNSSSRVRVSFTLFSYFSIPIDENQTEANVLAQDSVDARCQTIILGLVNLSSCLLLLYSMTLALMCALLVFIKNTLRPWVTQRRKDSFCWNVWCKYCLPNIDQSKDWKHFCHSQLSGLDRHWRRCPLPNPRIRPGNIFVDEPAPQQSFGWMANTGLKLLDGSMS